jgi:hypothetical protein
VQPDDGHSPIGYPSLKKLDVAESENSDFLYELESGAGKVNVYQISSSDSPLTLLQQMSTGLPQTGGVMGIAYINPADLREGQ